MFLPHLFVYPYQKSPILQVELFFYLLLFLLIHLVLLFLHSVNIYLSKFEVTTQEINASYIGAIVYLAIGT